jgi:alkanesulfonate monooxygenase SsuD/methylene tetrahydromethanopterin reductase-like flavin-dependent oxidoreductase (luciferase family)
VRFLLEPVGAETLDELAAAGEAARALGLDGVLLAPSARLPAPLIAAAALARRVDDIRIAVDVEAGDRHPIELAEEASIVDVASGGRLILAVRPAADRPETFVEALDLLRLSFAACPFRFEGEHWRVPSNLPQNEHNLEDKVLVTPPPAQARLELWGAGPGRDAALERGMGYLADADADEAELGRAWAAAPPAALGAPRARRERWTDAQGLIARLRAGRAAFCQDWAVVDAPREALIELGAVVRPRVQLDRLPAGLEEFWDEHRPWRELTLPGE